MIHYRKAFGGLFLLLQVEGSPAVRAIAPALLSAILALILDLYTALGGTRLLMEHPYPYQIFCFVVGFLLVFRTTFAYNRYQLALQHLTIMTSKWGDVALQILSFDTMKSTDGVEVEERQKFRSEVVHLVSLLHAVSLQKMRSDAAVENLRPYVPDDVSDGGCAGFQEPWLGGLVRVLDSTPRPSSHKSKAERWRCCRTPTSADVMRRYEAMPFHVHGGVPVEEADRLRSVDDRCFLVMQWLVDLLVDGRKWNANVEGPIVSRIYQELSDGMLGYNQARKFTEVPFPFPYAQLVLGLLCIYALSVPVVVVAWVKQRSAKVLLTFIAVWGYFAINEVNRELEDPFLHGPNDLPLPTLQADFNNRLQSLDARNRSNRQSTLVRYRPQSPPTAHQEIKGDGKTPHGKHRSATDVFTSFGDSGSKSPESAV
jgi:predicted membrane chloride channel (bestrophin family)